MKHEEYKLEVYVPVAFLNVVLDALHEAGAGRIGAYEYCFAVSEVKGFYKPSDAANPFEGAAGKVSEVSEYKIETRCAANLLPQILRVLRHVHPYEEPSVSVMLLVNHLFNDGD